MDFYNEYINMKPGKYWQLPASKKHLIKDYMKDNDYVGMIKYDGNWSRAIITENEVFMQTRTISKKTSTYGVKHEHVPHIVDELKRAFPAGTVLLGELCYTDLSRTSDEVGSILRCLPAKAVARQKDDKNKLHFKIFDVLAFNYKRLYDIDFIERFAAEFVTPGVYNNTVGSYNYVSPVESAEVPHIEKLLQTVWAQGGEGIILIHKYQPYNIGNRKAYHSIKVKRELGHLEGKVIGTVEPKKYYEGDDPNWQFIDGDGNKVTKPYYYGWKNGVIVEYKGRIFNIASGLTDEDRKFLATKQAAELIKNGELWAVFTGMQLTDTSVRHPQLIRLRDDM